MRFPALALIFLFLLLGCGPSERADLVFVNGGEPASLDPAVVVDQIGGRAVGSLFEGLTRLDQKGRPEPGMAESWTISEDGLVYVFKIRDAARWSNGDKLTAHHFVQSWRRVLLPETGSDYAAQLYYLKGAKEFSEACSEATKAGQPRPSFDEMVGLRALDDSTLEVTLENPTPFFLDLAAFITLYPVHLDSILDDNGQEDGDWIKPGRLVSNGPYLLSEWKLENRMRIRRNPYYWDDANTALSVIDLLPTDNPNAAVNFFIGGQVDLIMDKGMIPPGMTDALREQPWFHTGAFLGTYFVRLNVERPPFDDARVRRAFAMSVDKQRIVDLITRLNEPVAHGFVPPGAGADYQPSGRSLPYDPKAAAQLLAEAGHEGGRGLPSLDLLLRAKSVEAQIAGELQDMWSRHLGAPVSVSQEEARVYYASQREKNYNLSPSSWVGDYNDPNTFLDLFVGDNGNNRTGYSSPEYDEIIRQAAVETDPQERNQLFQRAEEIVVVEEAVIIPLYHYVGVQFYRSEELGGIEANVIDVHPFRSMYWKNK